MTLEELVRAVKDLDNAVNDGRGAAVLRRAVVLLQEGDVETAKDVLLNDRDKLWQYDEEHQCIAILERIGLLPRRTFWDGTGPTPYDLCRANAVKQFAAEHPREAGPVLDAVVMYLEKGDEESAQHKIMLDSDKFLDKRTVLKFMATLDLLDPEYRARLKL